MNRLYLTGSLLLLSLIATAGEIHESDIVAVNDTSRVVDLDEVIVVSQPKEGRLLRQQPLSSSVMTQQEMQQLQVRQLTDMSLYVPSFTMPQYGSRLTSSMYIRGIGSRVNNTAVGIYYDNIPLISKSAFNTHFYMLDRVDVLRGPQGTLYGANTEGGIVRIYSKNPMSYQGTDINLTAASGWQRKVEVAHYHRPSERLAFTVAGFYQGQKGFLMNTHLGERNDKADEAGAKVRLMWKANDRLTFDLTSDYQYAIQNGFPYGYYDEAENHTSLPATTTMNTYRRQMVNTGLNVSYDFGTLLLTSTTSHQYLWDRMQMDQDYVVDDYMHLMQQQKMNALTQEVVLRSKGEGIWKHTTGVFGSYQWLHTDAPVTFGPQMTSMLDAVMARVLPPTHTLKFTNFRIPGDFKTPQFNLGIYHETNLDLTEALTATLGLRYDFVQVKNDFTTTAMTDMDFRMAVGPRTIALTIPYASSYEASFKHTSNQLLPKFGLTWTFDEAGSNLFAVVSKGYRAGGYNLQAFSDIFQTEMRSMGANIPRDGQVKHTEENIDQLKDQISYDPETTWNYEFGTHLNLFNNKVKADVALFYTQIRNQQLSAMSPAYGYGRIIVNAGKSYSCGAELALRGSAVDNHLLWGATYSFVNAKFKEYDDYNDQRQPVSYKDNYVPFIPLHQLSAHGDYRFDIAGSVLRSLTLGANVQGQGKTYWEADNALYQKFYATLGAHAAFDLGVVVVDLWGRNLTNTHYNTFLVNSKITNQNFAQRGNPIQLGVDVNVHF